MSSIPSCPGASLAAVWAAKTAPCGSAITAIRPTVWTSIGPDSTRPPRASASLMVWSTSGGGGGGRDIGQPVGQGALLLGLVEKLHHPADSRLVVHPHSIGAGTAFPHLGAPPDELV